MSTFTIKDISDMTGYSGQRVRSEAKELGLLGNSKQGKRISFSETEAQLLCAKLGKNQTSTASNFKPQNFEVENTISPDNFKEEFEVLPHFEVPTGKTLNQPQQLQIDFKELLQLQTTSKLFEVQTKDLEIARAHIEELQNEIKELRREKDALQDELTNAKIELAQWKARKRLSFFERLTGTIKTPLLPKGEEE